MLNIVFPESQLSQRPCDTTVPVVTFFIQMRVFARLILRDSLRTIWRNQFATGQMAAWASAHRGKWGQLTPWKMGEKLKCENMQKSSFYVYVIFLEQSGQADVENGAMLTIFIQI